MYINIYHDIIIDLYIILYIIKYIKYIKLLHIYVTITKTEYGFDKKKTWSDILESLESRKGR